jgi:hypothetical protein
MLYQPKADSGGARGRFWPSLTAPYSSVSNDANIGATWAVGTTFEGEKITGTTWIAVDVEVIVKHKGVVIPPSGANGGKVKVYVSEAVAELAKPPPVTPPITPPTPPTTTITAAKLYGVHELGGRNRAADALAMGCRAVMCLASADCAANHQRHVVSVARFV